MEVKLAQINEATSARELCSLMYRFSEFRLLPEVVFNKRGGLRSFTVLKKRAFKQLTQTVNRPSKTLNDISSDFLDVLENTPVEEVVDALEEARTAQTRREYMRLGYTTARLYVDQNGYPHQ